MCNYALRRLLFFAIVSFRLIVVVLIVWANKKNHFIPTHFNTELDVSHAPVLPTFSKVTVTIV